MTQAAICGLVMLAIVLVLLLIGTPVAISIGMASVAAMFMITTPEKALLVSAQKIFAGTNIFSLLVDSVFVLAEF